MHAEPLPRNVDALRGRTFDLLVIGGGINGVGIARDAARRGLSVALVEREDFGYGTTGRSTRLIHGGLRYLAMYDFGLVWESLRERERLLTNAPHLVQPLTFLIPFYEGQKTPPWKLRLGLWLYDRLADSRHIEPHQTYTKEEIVALEPGLSQTGLRGGASYGDGQVAMIERLCVENALDAAAHGAVLFNHAECVSLDIQHGRVEGAAIQDLMTGETVQVHARRVVNTAGPWVDRVPGVEGVRTRMTKGIHLVNPPATKHAILLFNPADERVFFSIPWMGLQLVGTTDTDYRGDPALVAADAKDVAYLQQGIRFVLPEMDVETIHYTTAGLRNLVPQSGKKESEVTRRHEVVDHASHGAAGLVSLVGGKITPFRATSEEVVDHLGLTGTPSDTMDAPFPGTPGIPAEVLIEQLSARLLERGISAKSACTLASTYGVRAHAILDRIGADPRQAETLCTHAPLLRAEVAFVIETELARTAADVLLRRTSAAWMPCEGREALSGVLDVLDEMLGRDAAAREADKVACEAELAHRHQYAATSP